MLTHFQAKKYYQVKLIVIQYPWLNRIYFVPSITCGFVKFVTLLSRSAGHPPKTSINPDLVNSSYFYDKSGASKF